MTPVGFQPAADTDPQLHPSIPTFMFAFPQPIQLSYPTKDFLPTHPQHSHLHLQKQILSNSSSSTNLAVYAPILHLPPSLSEYSLHHLVLLLFSSTSLAVLHVYVVKYSTHLVVFPSHPLQSAPAVLGTLSLYSFPFLYCMQWIGPELPLFRLCISSLCLRVHTRSQLGS